MITPQQEHSGLSLSFSFFCDAVDISLFHPSALLLSCIGLGERLI